jgi:uncharacterized protein (DUF697 family)
MSAKQELARQWVNGYAVTGAGLVVVAVVPGVTCAALVAVEYTMCYHIGKIYRGDQYTWDEAIAAAGIVGLAAVAGKLLALEALTLLPWIGWAAKAPVAGAVIKGLGEAIISHYERLEAS